ncbi:putative Eukaryotic translation initiation factor 2 subunit beta [Paratrimastix pyriformis]|uniref:Eukaryotic translation initiation factor 2 subunit beta n=1 Tax=Paratrimastix pyriformis TaxID=342808 RepID=A0ABQ8URW9_9EUKA|nr:putative Eukaryotic translation initiation factor 2 subunit beta [Paratrimastix pyriformis]
MDSEPAPQTPPPEPSPEPAPEGAPAEGDMMMDSAAMFGKKKKKVKKAKAVEGEAAAGAGNALEDANREMSYEEMLTRIMTSLRTSNPALQQDTKLVLQPPQLGREGKKTIFINFDDICRALHREPDHLMTFMLAELGAQGNLDGERHLVVRDRFQTKHFEVVLKRYIREYVQCNMCKSTDTLLSREEGRMYQLTCGRCGASRCVQPMKTGFVAQVGKRRNQKKD